MFEFVIIFKLKLVQLKWLIDAGDNTQMQQPDESELKL